MAAVLQTAANSLGRRLRRWAAARQGTDPVCVELEPRRVYILPTRAGLVFGAIVFTMLLGAMNYSNNMGFALTFLLAALGIVSIHHCHHNLRGLSLRALGARPVYAGEPLLFRFALENPGLAARWQIDLRWDGGPATAVELAPGERRLISLPLPTARRGRRRAPRLSISTRFPLGLFRAWAWVDMDLAGLVYPQPASRASGTPRGESGRQETGRDTTGDDDYSGLRDWRQGDPPKRIAWKALARTGQKLVSEYLSGTPLPRWIDWESEPAGNIERRIARLARRVLDADASGLDYGLRIPGSELAPARGEEHRHRCLRALALFGEDAGR